MFLDILMSPIGLIVLGFLGFILLFSIVYKKVPQGKAIVRTGFAGAKVALDSGMLAFPILHKIEVLDISIHQLSFETEVETKDGNIAQVDAHFYVRVNKDPMHIVEVAQTVGCERASKKENLRELFSGKFIEGLKIVAREYNSQELKDNQDDFRISVLKHISSDLNGFMLDDLSIEKISAPNLSDSSNTFFVMLDSDKPLEKGEKVYVVDKINDGKSYIVRRI